VLANLTNAMHKLDLSLPRISTLNKIKNPPFEVSRTLSHAWTDIGTHDTTCTCKQTFLFLSLSKLKFKNIEPSVWDRTP